MRWFAAGVGVMWLVAGVGAVAETKSPVQWQVKAAPHGAVKAGAKFEVGVSGQIDDGWHVYAMEEPDGGPIATQVALADGDAANLLRVAEDKPHMVQDAAFNLQTGVHLKTVAYTLHLQAGTETGSRPLHVVVRYQSCNENVCLPPRAETIEVPLVIAR